GTGFSTAGGGGGTGLAAGGGGAAFAVGAAERSISGSGRSGVPAFFSADGSGGSAARGAARTLTPLTVTSASPSALAGQRTATTCVPSGTDTAAEAFPVTRFLAASFWS